MDPRTFIEAAGKGLVQSANRYLKAQIYLRQAKSQKQAQEAQLMVQNRAYELEKRKVDIAELESMIRAGKLKEGGEDKNEWEQKWDAYQKILEIEDEDKRNFAGRTLFGEDWGELSGQTDSPTDDKARTRDEDVQAVVDRKEKEYEAKKKELKADREKLRTEREKLAGAEEGQKAAIQENIDEIAAEIAEDEEELNRVRADIDRVRVERKVPDAAGAATTTTDESEAVNYQKMPLEALRLYVNEVLGPELEKAANLIPDEAAKNKALASIPHIQQYIVANRRQPTAAQLEDWGFGPDALTQAEDQELTPEEIEAVNNIAAPLTPEQREIYLPYALEFMRANEGKPPPSPVSIVNAMREVEPELSEIIDNAITDIPDDDMADMMYEALGGLALYRDDTEQVKFDSEQLKRAYQRDMEANDGTYTQTRSLLRRSVSQAYGTEGAKDIRAATKLYNAFYEMESILDQLAAEGIETTQIIGKIQKEILRRGFTPDIILDIPLVGDMLKGIGLDIEAHPLLIRLTNMVNYEISAYGKEISGAAIPVEEWRRFEQQFADIGRTDEVNRIAIAEGKSFAFRSLIRAYENVIGEDAARFATKRQYSGDEVSLRRGIAELYEKGLSWEAIKQSARQNPLFSDYTDTDFERVAPYYVK